MDTESASFVCTNAIALTYNTSDPFWNLSAYTITKTKADNKNNVIENLI
jgi:hypothetical protein